MDGIADDLRQNLLAGRVIPFVGAGVSMAVTDRAAKTVFPSWKELLSSAADCLDLQQKHAEANVVRALLSLGEPDYLDIARRSQESLGGYWHEFLRQHLDPDLRKIDPNSLALAEAVWGLGSKLIITTNFDRVLNWACPADSRQNLRIWNIEASAELLHFIRSGSDNPTVWHLHGSIDQGDRIILTSDSYRSLYPTASDSEVKYAAALLSLRFLLASHTLLFVGFSLDDPYFRSQLEWMGKVLPGVMHYALVRRSQAGKLAKMGLPVNPVVFEDHGGPLIDTLSNLAEISRLGQSSSQAVRAMQDLHRTSDAKGLEALLELVSLLLAEGKDFHTILEKLSQLRLGTDDLQLMQVSSIIAQDFARGLATKSSSVDDLKQMELRRLGAAANESRHRLRNLSREIEGRQSFQEAMALDDVERILSRFVKALPVEMTKAIRAADLEEGIVAAFRPAILAGRANEICEAVIKKESDEVGAELSMMVLRRIRAFAEEVQRDFLDHNTEEMRFNVVLNVQHEEGLGTRAIIRYALLPILSKPNLALGRYVFMLPSRVKELAIASSIKSVVDAAPSLSLSVAERVSRVFAEITADARRWLAVSLGNIEAEYALSVEQAVARCTRRRSAQNTFSTRHTDRWRTARRGQCAALIEPITTLQTGLSRTGHDGNVRMCS